MNIIDMHKAEWTQQQVTDEALARLEKQGCQAREGAVSCKYFLEGEDGKELMCAVGLLLPEPRDFKDLDESVTGLIARMWGDDDYKLFNALVEYRTSLDALQGFHDYPTRADHRYADRHTELDTSWSEEALIELGDKLVKGG